MAIISEELEEVFKSRADALLSSAALIEDVSGDIDLEKIKKF